jgi:hypothetical protein
MSLRSCSREQTRSERLRWHGTCAKALATWACRTPIPTSHLMSRSQSAWPVFQWVSKRNSLRPLFWSKRRITPSMPPRRQAATALPKTWLRPVAGLSRSVMGALPARRISRPVRQAGDKREPIRVRRSKNLFRRAKSGRGLVAKMPPASRMILQGAWVRPAGIRGWG